MCIKYMLFYTSFIIKEHFPIFREMVKKTLKMWKCHVFLVNYDCMLTDCQRKCNTIVVGAVVCTHFYEICVLYKGQSWGFTSRSTARVILGQVLRNATCGTRTHRGDSL